MKKIVCLLLLLSFFLFSCVTPDNAATGQRQEKAAGDVEITIETDIPSLKDVVKDHFLIGAAIEPNKLRNPNHIALLKKHFSSITAENCMKPSSLQPMEGTFNFYAADKLLEFARENGIAFRGHTLVWHNQAAEWMFYESKGSEHPASREQLKTRLKDHIYTIMEHFKGNVYAWDVVNEAIDVGKPDDMRNSKWYQIMGKEYIELAFRYAREADPDAKLFYNDYDMTIPGKRDAVIRMVKEMREKGVPIDGIGMQMHGSITSPTLQSFEEALAVYSGLGVEIHITELDINIYGSGAQSFETIPEELLIAQGYRVKDLFEIMKKYKNITSVTFWGLADDYSWLQKTDRMNWPLPFNEAFKAKPFYWGIVDPSKLKPRINMAKAVEGTPEIDGTPDDLWEFTEYVPNIPGTLDVSANVRTLWDKDNLYILTQVNDKTPARNDEITVFIDEKNDRTDTMDENDRILHYKLDKSWKNSQDAVVSITENGYIFEACIPFEHIDGKKAVKIGFDFSIKNDDRAVLKWNHRDRIESESPSLWGLINLDTAPKGMIVYEGTPVIDAEKDTSYNKGTAFPVDLFILGIQGEDVRFAGATANARVMWDSKGLSVYLQVIDPVLSDKSDLDYSQDSVEVFIDENNHRTTSYEQDDAQYRVNFKNQTSFGSTGSVEGFNSAAKIIPGGYAVEMYIPFRTITGNKGTIIGFDLQVNDDQLGNGNRASISKWNDPTNDSWQSTAQFGVVIFK
ncbi:MAG: endo-1,4-beta-xylanase [Spirochaetales bacterium]|nr:endo-1,4-beta-xylanase [Spirochaetales bacterium]